MSCNLLDFIYKDILQLELLRAVSPAADVFVRLHCLGLLGLH